MPKKYKKKIVKSEEVSTSKKGDITPQKEEAVKVPLDPLYLLSPLERFNQLPSYSTKLTNKTYTEIVAHYILMPTQKFKEIAKHIDKLSILEAQVVKGLVKTLGDSEKSFEIKKYFDDRVFGRAKQSIEHSGPNGTPMQMLGGNIQDAFDDLTVEEIEAIRNLANAKNRKQ